MIFDDSYLSAKKKLGEAKTNYYKGSLLLKLLHTSVFKNQYWKFEFQYIM